jgi:hypothetical protein
MYHKKRYPVYGFRCMTRAQGIRLKAQGKKRILSSPALYDTGCDDYPL